MFEPIVIEVKNKQKCKNYSYLLFQTKFSTSKGQITLNVWKISGEIESGSSLFWWI